MRVILLGALLLAACGSGNDNREASAIAADLGHGRASGSPGVDSTDVSCRYSGFTGSLEGQKPWRFYDCRVGGTRGDRWYSCARPHANGQVFTICSSEEAPG